MSLINEALKRAKQVQVRHVPEPVGEPALEPVLAPVVSSKDANRLIPIGAGLVLLLACWFFALWWRASHPTSEPIDTAARATNGLAEVMSAAAAFANSLSNKPASRIEAAVRSEFNTAPVSLGPNTPVRVPAPSVPETSPVEPTPASAGAPGSQIGTARTNEAAAQSALVERPTTHKLQGIFYRSARASALINGQTVFAGDDIDGATVLSIERQLVRLMVQGKTNTLKLR